MRAHSSGGPLGRRCLQVLPDTLKGSIFLPRPTKFQFDAAKLLNKSQRDKLVPTNPVGNSRVEFSVHPALDAARPWDNTTQITADSKKDYYAREVCACLQCGGAPSTQPLNRRLNSADFADLFC